MTTETTPHELVTSPEFEILIDAFVAVEHSTGRSDAITHPDQTDYYAGLGQHAFNGMRIQLAAEKGEISKLPIELSKFSSGDLADDAYFGIRSLEANENDGLPHQKRIELAGKRAVMKAFEGRRRDAVKAAAVAGGLALMSESHYNPSSAEELTLFERLKTKTKHLAVAGLALASALTPTKTSRKIIHWIS